MRAAIFCAIVCASSAVAQEVSQVEAFTVERSDSDRLPLAHTLRVRHGEARARLGRVRFGETLLSIPVEHRRTFVTLDAAENSRLTIPAGSVGYESDGVEVRQFTNGEFVFHGYRTIYERRGGQTVWCFFLKPEEPLRTRCVSQNLVLPGEHSLVQAGYRIEDMAHQPIIRMPDVQDRPAHFMDDMRLDFILRPSSSHARVALVVNDETIAVLEERWVDGVAEFELPFGVLSLQRGREAGPTVTFRHGPG